MPMVLLLLFGRNFLQTNLDLGNLGEVRMAPGQAPLWVFQNRIPTTSKALDFGSEVPEQLQLCQTPFKFIPS